MPNPLSLLRITALVEASSYLLLLGVAMPLKYVWSMTLPVKVVGMIHGVLFLLLIWLLVRAHFEAGWSKRRSGFLFLASLVPLWPFFLDRTVRAWIAASPPE